MGRWLFAHSAVLYWGLPVGLSLLLGIWEGFRPHRVRALSRADRWLTHGFLTSLTDAITILVFRIGGVAVAFAVSGSAYGVLNHASLPFPIEVLVTFLLLDLFQYGNHYLRHSIPLIWRFHQVHHSDGDVDFSTGFRFHPGEVLLTQAGYLLVIAALAPAPLAVLCYELLNIAQALFSHANLRLLPGIERALGLVLVTPEFHRIHHSVDVAEQRCNLGVLFSFWDRLFHTYRASPQAGEDRLQLGVDEVAAAESVRPLTMLALPFIRRTPRHGSSVRNSHKTGTLLGQGSSDIE